MWKKQKWEEGGGGYLAAVACCKYVCLIGGRVCNPQQHLVFYLPIVKENVSPVRGK